MPAQKLPPSSLSVARTGESRAWFVVHTKPRLETRALDNLTRQGYACYLPRIPVEKLRRGKCHLVEEPLFPRYLFINLDTGTSGLSWGPIRSTLGVRDLVRFGGQPAAVEASLIEAIRETESAIHKTPQTLFNAGERVVVTRGPFTGIEAVFQMPDAEGRALVLLEILSKPARMAIDPAGLRKAV